MQSGDEAGILVVPIWLAGTTAAVFVVALLLAIKRAGGVALIASLFRVGLIAAVVLGAWLYVQQHDSEHRALDDRKTALMAGSIAPGSALSCLDELAGNVVEAACEKAVFASPEAVAASVKYVSAQLALLNDGSAYAQRGNANYVAELAPLRTAIELDRFGLVAHVLSESEGCTVDRCEALTRLSNPTRVLGNLRDHTFEEQVNKYVTIWNAPHQTDVIVASENVRLPSVNDPGSPQTAVEAGPLPLPMRDPPARELILQSTAEAPVEAAASVAPLPPHRPPQVRRATPRAVAPQP
jgi:hypothetical protein